MTKIAIVPNAAGTGTFTIEAPNSNSNRTLVLPDSAGTVATAESTLAQFNATGSAPVYACRAWVNFDGTSPATIRASGNVSSVTRNAAGQYTVNFATALPDANYSAVVHCKNNGVSSNGSYTNLGNTDPTSSGFTVFALVAGGGLTQDVSWITCAAFR
jgi:hypothetical protein